MKAIRPIIVSVGFLMASGCSRTPHPASQTSPVTIPPGFEVEQRQPATPPVGRFQLLAAQHQIVSKKAQYDNKDVFRIDTVTGDTEVLQSGDGKDFWAPIK